MFKKGRGERQKLLRHRCCGRPPDRATVVHRPSAIRYQPSAALRFLVVLPAGVRLQLRDPLRGHHRRQPPLGCPPRPPHRDSRRPQLTHDDRLLSAALAPTSSRPRSRRVLPRSRPLPRHPRPRSPRPPRLLALLLVGTAAAHCTHRILWRATPPGVRIAGGVHSKVPHNGLRIGRIKGRRQDPCTVS